MQGITIAQITDALRTLPAEKLSLVYDFVSHLSEYERKLTVPETDTGSISKTAGCTCGRATQSLSCG